MRRSSHAHGADHPLSNSRQIDDLAAVAYLAAKTLSMLLNGHADIAPEMAVRLSNAFGLTPESWLQLQMNYNLAQINQQSDRIQVTRIGCPEKEPVMAVIRKSWL